MCTQTQRKGKNSAQSHHEKLAVTNHVTGALLNPLQSISVFSTCPRSRNPNFYSLKRHMLLYLCLVEDTFKV